MPRVSGRKEALTGEVQQTFNKFLSPRGQIGNGDFVSTMKSSMTISGGILLLVIFFCSSLPAVQTEKNPIPITHFRLRNGLHVILTEDYSLPVVSVAVAYNVGSFNEPEGKSGLAYLMESLMFQGSRDVGRMQHINFISRTGGKFNALTTADKTIFHQTVPSNQLALVLWLESDRMQSLNITREKVEQAKQSILDDIRYRKQGNPYMDSSLFFTQLLFADYSYNHPTMGFEQDMRDLTVQDVRAFYSTYYKPNNAVLCISGQIDKEETKQLVEKYFQTIAPGKAGPQPLKKEFHALLEDIHFTAESLASSPGFYIGFRLPPPFSDEYNALVLAEYILVRGPSSRIYKRLVKKDRLASSCEGEIDIIKNRAVFKIFVIINNERNRTRARKAVLSEINKFKTSIMSAKELNRAKVMLKADILHRVSTVSGKALFLVGRALDQNLFGPIQMDISRFEAVTPIKLMISSNRYLSKYKIILDVKIK